MALNLRTLLLLLVDGVPVVGFRSDKIPQFTLDDATGLLLVPPIWSPCLMFA